MKKSLLIAIPLVAVCLAACNSSEFEIHPDCQLNYINDNYKNIDKYTMGASATPDPLAYSISLDAADNNSKLVVSDNEDFSNSYELKLTSGATKYDFYNAKVGKTTYWKEIINGNEAKKGSFKTKETYPRNLYVKGVKNVRDLGYKGFIKQGLVYRGGEFEYQQGSIRTRIKEQGIEAIQQQLGVKTEIDLRNSSEINITKSSVENVNYINVPMYYKGTGDVFSLTDETTGCNNTKAIKDVFSILANKDNYPVYFHCAAGKDRTGVIAYLIEAITGCEEDHIYKDYLFSNFVNSSDVKLDTILNTYVKNIQSQDGSTLKDKTINYLVSNGFSESDINSVIKNLQD